MENVVLGLLMIQSLTLYELNQAFKRGISLFYSASYGSLQAAVKSLLSKGLIDFEEKVESGRNKKIYSITEAGKSGFYAWMREKVPANKVEVTALSKLFFLGLVPEMEERKQIVAEIVSKIEVAKAELEQIDEEIRQAEFPEIYQEILKFQLKTLDYGIQSHAFGKKWFQDLLDELESSQPPGE
jgi:PadR family transcriptional regulator, regulatory protein AphA